MAGVVAARLPLAIDKDGHLKVQHSDGLKATQLMAIATGKLKTNVLQPQFDHARYLTGIDEPPAKDPAED